MKLLQVNVSTIGFELENTNKLCIKLENNHLIYSDKNSKGKTTLVRFLIYSLGFKIPSTRKVDMRKFQTELIVLRDDNTNIKITRNDTCMTIEYEDKSQINFDLNSYSERYKALSNIFQCNNLDLLENILAVFYIDQDRGWRLVNRGGIIGENGFNIENFILALNNNNEEDVAAEIRNVDSVVKRYESIRNIMSYEIDANNEKDIYNQDDVLNGLLAQKGIKKYEIADLKKKINDVDSVIRDNDSIMTLIEKYNLIVQYREMEFVLKKEHIQNYNINQNILKADLNSLFIDKKLKELELATIQKKIEEANVLVKVDNMEEILVREIQKLPISEFKLEEFIDKKRKELTKLKNLRREIVRDEDAGISEFIAEKIKIIANELDVFDVVSLEKDYIFTHNIKSLSGAILHKISFSYKIAYILAIEKYIGIKLPMIIDSPCSGEVTLENAIQMLQVAKKHLLDNQLIVASIYSFEDINFEQRTKLINGVFGGK